MSFSYEQVRNRNQRLAKSSKKIRLALLEKLPEEFTRAFAIVCWEMKPEKVSNILQKMVKYKEIEMSSGCELPKKYKKIDCLPCKS